MEIYIKKDALETKKFRRHIYEEAMRHYPLRAGELIQISVSENSTNFPIFAEHLDAPYFVSEKGVQLLDETERKRMRNVVLSNYFLDEIIDFGELLNDDCNTEKSGECVFSFSIRNLENFYKCVKEVGIEIPKQEKSSIESYQTPPEFQDNPAGIKWRRKIMPLEIGSREFDVSRLMWKIPVNKFISWDEVDKEVEAMPKEEELKRRKQIQDTVSRLNKKAVQLFEEPLLEWQNLSIRRIV